LRPLFPLLLRGSELPEVTTREAARDGRPKDVSPPNRANTAPLAERRFMPRIEMQPEPVSVRSVRTVTVLTPRLVPMTVSRPPGRRRGSAARRPPCVRPGEVTQNARTLRAGTVPPP